MPPVATQPTQVSTTPHVPNAALALGSAPSSPSSGSNSNAATQLPSYFPVLGIGLAVFSSLLIGLSYVLQKRGMTRAQISKRRKRAAAAEVNAVAAADRGQPPEPVPPTAFLDSSRTPGDDGRDSDVVIRIDHVEDEGDGQGKTGCTMMDPPSADSHESSGMSTSIVRPAAENNGTRSRRASCTEKHPAGQAATTAHETSGSGLAKEQAPIRAAMGSRRRRRGPPYLYSRQWWFGTFLNLVGEAANLGAYAFTSAIVVAPLGALSVVVSAILSSFMLAERMNLQGKLGCALSLMGSTILVLNAPAQVATADMEAFSRAYFAPAFVAWNVVAVIGSLVLIFHVVPRFRSNALGYLGACSLLGSLSVIEIQAVATAVVGSIATHSGSSPTASWLWWAVLFKAIVELVSQLYFLNEALARFSAVLVTPLYYAGFTSATLLANFLLNPPWSMLDARTAFTCLLAFAIICSGVLLLQTSKITTTTTTEVAAVPATPTVPGSLVNGTQVVGGGTVGQSESTLAISRQRSVMSFSHERLPSMRHSPLLQSTSIPMLVPGTSSSTLLPVPAPHSTETFLHPYSASSHLHFPSGPTGPHGRDPSVTSIMLTPFVPASAPAVTSSSILHVHTREQPWLHTTGHFPELLSALMRALHSTMDENDADELAHGSPDSPSSLADSGSSSVKFDKNSLLADSGQRTLTMPQKDLSDASRKGSQSPGVASISRRARAMSWPGPGAALADVNVLRRAASPIPDRTMTTANPSVSPAHQAPQKALRFMSPAPPASASEARRRAAALRGRLQSAMQLVQWLSSQVAAAGFSAAGSMAAGMNTASGLVRHHPPNPTAAPAPSPIHSTIQHTVHSPPTLADRCITSPVVPLRPSLSEIKAAEAMALSDVKQE